MKKTIRNLFICLAVIVALIMIFSLSACSDNMETAETKSLYVQGLEVVQLMSEMTQMEEYIDMYTGSSEIKAVIQDISTGEYLAPKAVYAISISDKNLAAMAELGDLNDISKGLKDFLMQKVFGSLMTQINGMSGVQNLAASSVCTVGKTFVNENADDNVIYLYTYENAVPVAVTFMVGDDKAISASGVFIMYDGFTCESIDEIKSFFGDSTVEVSEVHPEK